ncbi:MAG: hypothetical protein ACP5VN_01445 [Acidobacteriota bacterium]
MRRVVTAFLFLSLGVVGFSAGEGGGDWSITRGMRSHLRITTESGQVFLLSSLQRSRGKNPSLNKAEIDSTLLIETSSGNRYVVTMRSESDLNWAQISSRMTLQALGQKDPLAISYETLHGEGAGIYRIESPRGQVSIEEAKVPASYSGLHPSLATLPEETTEILHLLRALYVQPVLFVTVTAHWMAPVFGTSPSEKAVSVRAEFLPPDCAFDAAFGFPCSKNENVTKNGKCMVVSLDP